MLSRVTRSNWLVWREINAVFSWSSYGNLRIYFRAACIPKAYHLYKDHDTLLPPLILTMPPSCTGSNDSHSESPRRSYSLPPNTFSSTWPQPGPALLWSVNCCIQSRSFPSKYNPNVAIPDCFSYGDLAAASCQYLADQVYYNFTLKKLLAGYGLEDHEYILSAM